MPTFDDTLYDSFQNELSKIAKAMSSSLSPIQKNLMVAAGGAASYEALRRANQDRKMGRMMRIQQGGQY